MYPEYGKLLIVLFLGLAGLAGCVGRCDEVRKTTMATPMPPPELLALPVNAQIHCDDNPNYRTAVTLWEFPGTEPRDPDSSCEGHVGKDLGYVKDCSAVRITDYAWSEADQTFYVYVEAEVDQEYFDVERDSLEGWVEQSLVVFLP
jgi:hypothetical protein